jgi:AP endonuclease 2
MNPEGMFVDGVRTQQWTTKNLLPMSGKLIPEFDRRRNIRDMFSRKPSLQTEQNFNGIDINGSPSVPAPPLLESSESAVIPAQKVEPFAGVAAEQPPSVQSNGTETAKRSQKEASLPTAKRAKSAFQAPAAGEQSKGQKSLKGFFAPKVKPKPPPRSDGLDGAGDATIASAKESQKEGVSVPASPLQADMDDPSLPSPTTSQQSNVDQLIDPIVSKESWGKLFVKPVAPKCEHEEPCKTMLTKKSGVNCGRSFWMCARPLGPSGNKEKNTQWRCGTFIWASDWNGGG